MFIKKTLIFSKTVDYIHIKMLQNDVKYTTTIEPSKISSEKLLVFQKNHIICNNTNLAWNSVSQNNIDFLKNYRLISHKNALKWRKKRATIEQSNFSNEKLLVFQKNNIICNNTNLALNSDYQKNIDFLKNCRLNSHKNALKRRKVQNYNRTKQNLQWKTASFSEKSYHLQ